MDYKFTEGKPFLVLAMWNSMEDLQELFPHFHWGWSGFVPIINFV